MAARVLTGGFFCAAAGPETDGTEKPEGEGTERKTDRKKPGCKPQTDVLYYKSCRREAAGSLFEN